MMPAGSGGAGMAGSAGGPTAGSAGMAGSPVDAEQWTVLTEGDWMLPAGGELEQHCADKMLTEDVYISAIRPIHPRGTHHTTLSVSATATACSTLEVLQSGIIYAAGVGTEVLRMPPGVAMKLPAGQRPAARPAPLQREQPAADRRVGHRGHPRRSRKT